MRRNMFKKHPLLSTFLASLLAALPASLITEWIAMVTGPERMNQFVREMIVIFWAAGTLGVLAFVGFREAGKSGRERRRAAQVLLLLFAVVMALLAIVIFASAVFILIDANLTGNFSLG